MSRRCVPGGPCEQDGCDQEAVIKHLCYRHYKRQYAWAKHPPTRWGGNLADHLDEAVVLRLISGEPCPATTYERREAVRRLRLQRRLTYTEIARHLHVGLRQVHRDLCALGLVESRRNTA